MGKNHEDLYEILDFDNNKIIVDKINRYHYITDDIESIQVQKGIFGGIDKYLTYINNINYLSNVYYNITTGCNLACSYCYSENTNKFVDLETHKTILNNLIKLKTKVITLIGGEPFFHPNFYEILESIVKLDEIKNVCIVTNGTLIDENKISILKNPKIILQISLDGVDEETNSITRSKGSFTKAINRLKVLKENNINFKVMQTITRKNICISKKFYDYFKGLNVDVGYFMVKKVEDDLKPQLDQLEDLLDYIYYNENKEIDRVFDIVKFADNMLLGNEGFPIMHCGAGITNISISPKGDIFPCVKVMNKDDRIGSLLNEEGIKQFIINRKNILRNDLVCNKKKCSKCSIKYFCGGGCRAESLYCGQETNEYNCSYFKFAYTYYFRKVCNNEE